MPSNTPSKLPLQLIRESFDIDESSPTWLRWKHRPAHHFENDRRHRQANARCAGKPAGTICWVGDRHKSNVYIGATKYSTSRVVFALAYGYDPGNKDVDHIDGDRSNNNPSNLRAITHSQNCFNRCIKAKPQSGTIGVYWLKASQRWASFITVNKQRIYLGCFKEKEDAIAARREAEVKYHGEYALSVSRVGP